MRLRSALGYLIYVGCIPRMGDSLGNIHCALDRCEEASRSAKAFYGPRTDFEDPSFPPLI